MIRTHTLTSALVLVFAALMLAGLSGCTSDPADDVPMTESDAARLEAEKMQEKASMLARGEELVRDGEAERARGQAMVDQGNTLEGQPMVAGGDAKVAQGQALIERANDMDTSVEPVQIDVEE